MKCFWSHPLKLNWKNLQASNRTAIFLLPVFVLLLLWSSIRALSSGHSYSAGRLLLSALMQTYFHRVELVWWPNPFLVLSAAFMLGEVEVNFQLVVWTKDLRTSLLHQRWHGGYLKGTKQLSSYWSCRALKSYCVFHILTVSCYNNQLLQTTWEEILISYFSQQCLHSKLNQYVKWPNHLCLP